MSVQSLCFWVGFLFFILPVFGQNILTNSGFEEDGTGWREIRGPGNNGHGQRDTVVCHAGRASFKISNSKGVYRIFQVHELAPGGTYLIGGWFKGKGVTTASIGKNGGPAFSLPGGSFGWTWVGGTYTLGGNENTVDITLVLDGPAEAVWADDVYVGPAGTGNRPPEHYTNPPDKSELKARITQRLAEEKAHMQQTKELWAKRPELRDNSYVKMGVVLAELFLRRVETGGPWREQTADEGGPMAEQAPEWSLMQLNQIREVLNETQRLIGKTSISDAPRLTGGPATIRNGVFYTTTTWGDRPFYFYGYGAGSTVAQAIPFLSELGATYIQQERGPSSMDENGKIIPNDYNLSIFKTFKSASEHRVKIDFLFSPHYFPSWAYSQAPDVHAETGGWNRFNVNHPKAQEVIGKWIEVFLAKTKNEPALFSCCLMNEPGYTLSGRDNYSRPLYLEFLKKRHHTITALNALYETNYFRFDEVIVPTTTVPQAIPARRAYFDWALFNMENFADWHRFMHNEVKNKAPQAYTHSKIIIDAVFSTNNMLGGVDPEAICDATDLAGNDCAAVLTPDYAFSWSAMEMGYDLLHSFKNQPVVNTENHIDYDPVGLDYLNGYFPPSHVRGVLWQSALHHLSATAIWSWAEPTDRVRAGHIAFRPANVYAAGKTMFDINRLAEEITVINQSPPAVAILYSGSSIFWQDDYAETIQKLYPVLNFMGLQITFVSDRQLAAGSYPKTKIILLPHATHVPGSTLKALDAFVTGGGRVIRVGQDCLAWDDYHRKHTWPAWVENTPQITWPATDRQINTQLRTILNSAGLNVMMLTELDTKTAAWGVEYRTVPFGKSLLVPMINLLKKPQTVRLHLKGTAVDLLSGEAVDLARIPLGTTEPRLLKVQPR